MTAIGEEDRALDGVSKLAHVPRPPVILEHGDGVRGERDLSPSELLRELDGEISSEERDVGATVPERGNDERKGRRIR